MGVSKVGKRKKSLVGWVMEDWKMWVNKNSLHGLIYHSPINLKKCFERKRVMKYVKVRITIEEI
jgi:hypothetical protein